jgi:hypothetical protein
MRIVEEPLEFYGNELIEVKEAIYSDNYIIRIRFNNGVEKLVNFKPFLLNSGHPSIRKYLDEKLFREFKIIDGNLNWNDFDLIFPIEDLLEGKI